MMLVRTYLAASNIEGLGVFTAEPLAKGQAVWRFDPRFDQLLARSVLEEANPALREFLERYTYDFHDDPAYIVLDMDDGRYMNHAEAPNVDLTDPTVGIATRDIAAGEELTCDYACFTSGAIEFQPSRGLDSAPVSTARPHMLSDAPPIGANANGAYHEPDRSHP